MVPINTLYNIIPINTCKPNNLSGQQQWSHPFFCVQGGLQYCEGSRSVSPKNPRERMILTSPTLHTLFRIAKVSWRKAHDFAAILLEALKKVSQKYYAIIGAES